MYVNALISTPVELPAPHRTGRSAEDRPIPAYRFGREKINVSLIAGCHADEPAGPRLLRKLVTFLTRQEPNHPLLRRYTWWIIPHVNPDGEAANRQWYDEEVNKTAHEAGLRPAPVEDQMRLQWAFVTAGIEKIER